MLSKKHRLSKTAEVKKTAVKGRGFFNPYFVIKSLANKGDFPRFTVVVSTKVSKKAVDRNRVKRIIREAIKPHLSELPSNDYVLTVKSGILRIDSSEIRCEVEKALKQLANKKQ